MSKILRISRRLYNFIIYAITYKRRHAFKILNLDDTVYEIVKNKKSISRFGDGEFDILFNYLGISDVECGFQKFSESL